MKKTVLMRRIVAAVLTAALSASVVFGLTGCGKEERTTYLKNDHVEFYSDEEMEAWRAPLETLLAGNMFDQPDALHNFVHVGLMDLDLDGTPEVLVRYDGGTACNLDYDVYDLMSGGLIGHLATGSPNVESNALVVYRDPADGRLYTIGFSNMRGGWQELVHSVSRISVTAASGSDRFALEEMFFVCESYVSETENGELAVKYNDVTYYVSGGEVDRGVYYHQYEVFLSTMQRIPETAMKIIPVMTEGERSAEELADKLIGLGQHFIKNAW